MTSRSPAIIVVAVTGLVGGPMVLRAVPDGTSSLPWLAYPIASLGCAVGVPLLLAAIGGAGQYRTMSRVWTLLGILALLLATAGASSAALGLVDGGAGQRSLMALFLGAGLLAGLGIVKLALRRARARAGA